ncbi:MAG: MFS transporter [Pseudomonadota bacterium]
MSLAPETTAPHASQQDEGSASIFAPRYRATTIGMVGLVALVAYEALAVVTAMPTAALALDGLPLYALAFGGKMATSVVGTTLAGQWCDARGPAAPLWASLACFVGGLLLAGLAPDMPTLIAGRMAQGLGGGGITVALYALVARRYPTTMRPRVFAAFATSWAIPALFGPALSGLAVEAFGWRSIFLVIPLIALPAALLLRPALRATTAAAAAAGIVSPRRVALSFGAATGICLLHVGGQLRGGPAAAVLIPAAALAFACTVRLLPTGTPIAARGLPTVVALRGLVCAAFFGVEAFLPLLLSRERGLSPALAGLALTAGAISWTFGSWFQGHARNGWSRHRFLRTGTTALCAGLAVAALAVLSPVHVFVAVSGWAVAGLGMGMISPSLSVLVLSLSALERQGANSAALPLSEAVAVSTAMALGGSLFAALLPVSVEAAYLANFAIAVAAALLAAAIVGRADAHRFVVN